jgi:hypothetical protein
MINYGKTAKILVPPLSKSSSHPLQAKNLYGSSYSLKPNNHINYFKIANILSLI